MRLMIAILVLVSAAAVQAGDKKKVDPVRIPAIVDLSNKKCPISGEDVDGETHVDWNGIRVQVCCPGCDKKFRAKPEKYLPALGLTLVKTKKGKSVIDLNNAKCPAMGGPAKAAVFGDHGGVRIHYCCPGCDKGVRKDPAKAMAKLGYKYIPSVIDLRNAKCPVMGGKPDAEEPVSTTYDGISVRFCCPMCVAKCERDPAAFFKKLGVDPAKLKATLK